MGKPTRYYSKKQEQRGNKILGLDSVPNSGATAFMKGDGQDNNMLMEWKTLTKQQQTRTISKEWFTVNKQEAFAMGKIFSAVGFDFGDGEDYIAVDIYTFRELYEAWKGENGNE